MKSVLVLGGGVSGLCAALELCASFDVTVVERRARVGGKARTWTDPRYRVFREHSFRVFHRTYANLFECMRRVPAGDPAGAGAASGSVYDQLEEYIDKERLFASYPITWQRYRSGAPALGLRGGVDLARDLAALLGLLVASDQRLSGELGARAFEDLFRRRPDGGRGLVFDVLRAMSQVEYSADRLNPDVQVMRAFIEKHFLHVAPGLGWKALNGPTSDTFIEPFRRHLQAAGVRFRLDTEVVALEVEGGSVQGIGLRDLMSGRAERAVADAYVCALPSDRLLPLCGEGVLAAAPPLRALSKLRRVWNNGAIVYTSRRQDVRGGYYMWHPWRIAVTSYARRWSHEYDPRRFGVGEVVGRIADVLSYVICDWQEPGPGTGKPARDCSPDEIYAELCFAGRSDASVVANFDSADHVELRATDGERTRILVDEALRYDTAGGRIVDNEDTLVHVPPGVFRELPGADVGLEGFALASTHCAHSFGCGDSMEGACETGRRAANLLLSQSSLGRPVTILEGRGDAPALKVLRGLRRVDAAVWGMQRALSRSSDAFRVRR